MPRRSAAEPRQRRPKHLPRTSARLAGAEPVSRNRSETECRILQPVGTILAERGFGHRGMNEIAPEAQANHVPVNRYFGGLEELIRAHAQRGDFWPRSATC